MRTQMRSITISPNDINKAKDLWLSGTDIEYLNNLLTSAFFDGTDGAGKPKAIRDLLKVNNELYRWLNDGDLSYRMRRDGVKYMTDTQRCEYFWKILSAAVKKAGNTIDGQSVFANAGIIVLWKI